MRNCIQAETHTNDIQDVDNFRIIFIRSIIIIVPVLAISIVICDLGYRPGHRRSSIARQPTHSRLTRSTQAPSLGSWDSRSWRRSDSNLLLVRLFLLLLRGTSGTATLVGPLLSQRYHGRCRPREVDGWWRRPSSRTWFGAAATAVPLPGLLAVVVVYRSCTSPDGSTLEGRNRATLCTRPTTLLLLLAVAIGIFAIIAQGGNGG